MGCATLFIGGVLGLAVAGPIGGLVGALLATCAVVVSRK